MDFDFTYVSKACPELTKHEVEIIIQQLQCDSRYVSATEESIRALAKDLFPYSFQDQTIAFFDYRDQVEQAIRHLEYSVNCLERIPRLPEDIERTMFDIMIAHRHLYEELQIMKDKDNVQ